MVTRVILDDLEQRKITCSCPDSNPGPSSPFSGCCTGCYNNRICAMSVDVIATGDRTGTVLGTASSSA
jgi:hypothetical protein